MTMSKFNRRTPVLKRRRVTRNARDVIFPKPVSITLGKVVFPGQKLSSQFNPRFKCIGNFIAFSRILTGVEKITPLVKLGVLFSLNQSLGYFTI